MRAWSPERVADAAGARLISAGVPGEDPAAPGPLRAEIDSRAVLPGDLFVGLVGDNVDGGRFAPGALVAGAWGVLVGPDHAEAASALGVDAQAAGAVLVAEDPLRALQRLANAWRRALACPVIGVTGSVGKTTTKDLLAAMIASTGVPVVANEKNLNTEIGLPLTVLRAPAGTEALVLEMGMRGAGQIAELCAIAEPDIGVITALGPVHLEQLGTMEAIAAEKASLVAALPAERGTAILPAGEPLLDPHVRADLRTVTFGRGDERPAPDLTPEALAGLGLEDRPAHVLVDACAALAAARAIGAEPDGGADGLPVSLSEMRGQRHALPGGVTVVDDCYNANPLSMRAALADLAATAPGRRVAVLGDMRELGPDEVAHHERIGAYAREAGVELLVAVGPLSAAYGGDHAVLDAATAASLVPSLIRAGDTVLVKASRGVGLEAVTGALRRAETAKLWG